MTHVENVPEVKILFQGQLNELMWKFAKSLVVIINEDYNLEYVKRFNSKLNQKVHDIFDVPFEPIDESDGGISAETLRMAEATLPPGFERVDISINTKPNTDEIETVIKGGVVHRVIDGELIEESKLTPEDLEKAAKKLQERFNK